MFLPVVAQSFVVRNLGLDSNGFTVGPPEIEQNADSATDIFFGNIGSFKFKPIIPTLVHLTDAVKQTIRQFEALDASRI